MHTYGEKLCYEKFYSSCRKRTGNPSAKKHTDKDDEVGGASSWEEGWVYVHRTVEATGQWRPSSQCVLLSQEELTRPFFYLHKAV